MSDYDRVGKKTKNWEEEKKKKEKIKGKKKKERNTY